MNSNINSKMMMNNGKNIIGQQQGNNKMNGFNKGSEMQQMSDKGKGLNNGFNNNINSNMVNNINNSINNKFPPSNTSNRPIIP
jgi:hypothetical protein